MLALLIHLFLAAFILPVIGGLVFTGFLIASFTNDIGMMVFVVILLACFALFVGWYVFVPLGCISFWFFCATATRHPKGIVFWVIAWALIGAGSGAVYAFATKDRSVVSLICSGIAAGLAVGPLHRRVWAGLYPDSDSKFQMPAPSERGRV